MADRKWIDDGYQATELRDLRRIRWVLIITMLLNFLATAIKLAAGLATGALSVVADGLDSLFDGISNLVGLVGLNLAARPPDSNHPYGHRKFETIAALSIAFLLFLTSWQLLQTAWARWWSDEVPEINLWTIAAIVVSMLIQGGTSYYELRQGRKLSSEVLVADALHTRASILISLSVLIGLLLVGLGFPKADPLLAAFVALMIAKIGVDILREILPVLVDQAAFDPSQIAQVVDDVGGIESFNRVRSRGAAGSAAIDLHVRVSAEKTVREANVIADEVRRRLLSLDGVSDVTVQIEAARQSELDAGDLFSTVKHAAADLDLTVHEIWAHRYNDDLALEVHIGVDPQLSLGEAHTLVDQLEQEILQRRPEIKWVHTHIELASSQVQQLSGESIRVSSAVRSEVESAVADIPHLSNPHNIRMQRNPADGNLIYMSLECTVEPDLPVTQAHQLASQLENELSRRLPEIADVSVHIEPHDQV
ncbi:MAG TPA: cation-efflux pump [Anaerolineales bacterium]|nr:cation-efflux pump [Anaerolineales bacterium]